MLYEESARKTLQPNSLLTINTNNSDTLVVKRVEEEGINKKVTSNFKQINKEMFCIVFFSCFYSSNHLSCK